MIFNFTDKYKFAKNVNSNYENLEVVKQAKLLGVIISDDLKQDKNTEYLVEKAYSRMELLRKVAESTKSIEYKREIYIHEHRKINHPNTVLICSNIMNGDKCLWGKYCWFKHDEKEISEKSEIKNFENIQFYGRNLSKIEQVGTK